MGHTDVFPSNMHNSLLLFSCLVTSDSLQPHGQGILMVQGSKGERFYHQHQLGSPYIRLNY